MIKIIVLYKSMTYICIISFQLFLNMKHTILFCLLFTFIIKMEAQEVISTAGNYNKNDVGSLSFTIGEPVIETTQVSDYKLTQGFQQSRLIISSTQEERLQDNRVKVYPNPADNYINIEINRSEENIVFIITETNGKEIITCKKKDVITSFDITNFSSGIYFLNIKINNAIIETFKIIKQ